MHDQPGEPTEPINRAASGSLVLGILSIVGGLTSLPGLIFGVVGLRRAKQLGGAGRGSATAGIVMSGVGVVVAVWGYFAVQRVREAAARMAICGNFKQVSLAVHNFQDSYDSLPSPFARDLKAPFIQQPEGELVSKMSWRVSILPFIEHDHIFRLMNIHEPWNSPTNRPFAAVPVKILCDPPTRDDPDTRRRVFYGPGTAWPLDRQMKLADITDGTENTILLVESGEKVTWTRFAEMKYDPANPPDAAMMGRPATWGFVVALCDGSVRSFRKTMDPQVLKALITAHAGDRVDLDGN